MISIRVRFFSDYLKYTPKGKDKNGWETEVEPGIDVQGFLKFLEIPEEKPRIVIVNDTNESGSYLLKENDFLKIFPLARGG